jgi:platelet-activating factor acetylhydrolase
MIFSHGLGGSRNAYSHLVGSIASHGVIVIAPEHRDGSCPITFIRDVPSKEATEKHFNKNSKRMVDYNRISHTPSPEVEVSRNSQLKIRLWELGCIHDALIKMDEKDDLTNLNTSSPSLAAFGQKMAVHEPGSITFAGHSFGAATTVQLVKNVFYSSETSNAPPEYQPLFAPSSRSAISKQITPNTPVVLLDVWCMPLRSAATRWLWNKPMPCYTPGGPGGCGILAVESQAFFKWRVHLKATKRLLSLDPSSDYSPRDSRPAPHFYYPSASAHLSQSDFGVLFPWFTKKVFAAEEPERVMKLNVRAILQLLRERKVPVSATSPADMEMGSETKSVTEDDVRIFTTGEEIRGWNFLATDVSDMTDVEIEDDKEVAKEPSEAVVGGELREEIEGTGSSLGMEREGVKA